MEFIKQQMKDIQHGKNSQKKYLQSKELNARLIQ